ncbi:hypothetical protein ACFYST_05200 [Kitasatospora sp. NPDC004614]|uniref:hypothetical protein n=1 Tax=unclassified Kitasatospora TaxID=2633591 RepID=UPI00368E1262
MSSRILRVAAAFAAASALPMVLSLGAQSASASPLPVTGHTVTSSPTPGIASKGYGTAFTPTVKNPATATQAELAAAGVAKPQGLSAGAAASGVNGAITRDEVIARAQSWVDQGVPYSQTSYWTDSNGTYRQDCSGFISMAWHLSTAGTNYGDTTWTLPNYATQLGSYDDLKPGDMLDNIDTHVVLFKEWADSGHTVATVMEEAHSGTDARISTRTRSDLTSGNFRPYRYDNIVDSAPAPTSLSHSSSTVVDQNGTVRVYRRGADSHIYENHLDKGGPWSGWWDMGGNVAGQPAATVAKDGTIIVVGVGADHVLYEADLRPFQGWNKWMNLGGSNLDNNPAAVTDNNGTVRVYAHGTNGHLYEKTVVPGEPWSVTWDMGGDNYLTGSPSATVAKDNTVIVVAVGADHRLYENDLRPNQRWNVGMDLGGSNLDHNPAAITDNNGTVRIYAHGTNGHLYEKTVVPGEPWSVTWDMGGDNNLVGSPSVAIGQDNTVIVVAHGADRKLYENDLRPNQPWNIGMNLGGEILAGSPSTVTDTDGTVRVYSGATNGNVFEKSVVPGQPWSVMWSLGGNFPA